MVKRKHSQSFLSNSTQTSMHYDTKPTLQKNTHERRIKELTDKLLPSGKDYKDAKHFFEIVNETSTNLSYSISHSSW